MTAEERDELIDGLLDGEISEADFLRLEAEMHIDPEVRQAYYERLKLDTNLQVEAESRGGGRPDSSTGGRAIRRRQESPGWLGWASAAVLAVLVALLGWKVNRDAEAAAGRNEEPIASGFGVVAGQSEADWDLNPGDLLPQGPIHLKSGIARLDLFSGVTAIIEGEAEFEVLSSMELAVTRGKIRLKVPNLARGFRVRTAGGEVVDPGPELALRISPEQTDLQVVDGRTEWHPLSNPVRILLDGETLRWSVAEGEVTGATALVGDVAEFENRMAQQHAERKEAWDKLRNSLRGDPALLAWFSMDRAEDRTLADQSSAMRDGTIVRAARVPDRWGAESGGLDFSPTGSRVRVEIPGDHESLTLMCWAKIDSLDRWYNSLFLTDGHELHEPHWQIMDDGRIFFSVKANEAAGKGKDKHIAFSPPIWTPAESGKWLHIATVFDGKAKTTTHYVNGEAISRDEILGDLRPEKVRIGAASIGNWSDPRHRTDPHFAVRNLNGTIDEFAIFARPLNAEEVREIAEKSMP
ncbi:MAG: hypothetical protein HKN23_02775 [Verrucomicrobiales bacterium]|nr:hypothetical protein [Verrucomicrobiales bacterium]